MSKGGSPGFSLPAQTRRDSRGAGPSVGKCHTPGKDKHSLNSKRELVLPDKGTAMNKNHGSCHYQLSIFNLSPLNTASLQKVHRGDMQWHSCGANGPTWVHVPGPS